jgi:hypothetical protein
MDSPSFLAVFRFVFEPYSKDNITRLFIPAKNLGIAQPGLLTEF